MKHILGLASVAFALGVLGSPLAAQEMAQATPLAEQLPPPPPFPPMPSSRPSHRYVNTGSHHLSRSRARKGSTHKARSAKHHASSTHRVRTYSSKRAVRKEKPLHFSKTTIRQCHGMTYRQIMRHSSCRALMKQELAALPAAKHRTSHKASGRHKATTRSRSHSTAKKRRR